MVYACIVISAVNLWSRLQLEPTLLIVDVRDADEFAAGSIVGAQNLPHDHAISELPTILDSMRSVVFVCSFGQRSSSACAALRRLGFTAAVFLDGGLDEWTRAGFPLACLPS
jgi:rhodanese-related sulfurtransferase